jgi:hypothetical protein
MFLFRKRFWLTVLKVLALAFVGWMITLQIPELQYDLGPETPVQITSPDQLTRERFPHATFVAIEGTPSFENAFIYRRYGLAYTYFNVEPYGLRLVARTYEDVTDEWTQLHRFVGKLRPFERQPFSYRIRDIYEDRHGVEVPQDAFFLALYDVPEVSGWQIGAVVFASVLWLVMLYLFFIHRWKTRPADKQGDTAA